MLPSEYLMGTLRQIFFYKILLFGELKLYPSVSLIGLLWGSNPGALLISIKAKLSLAACFTLYVLYLSVCVTVPCYFISGKGFHISSVSCYANTLAILHQLNFWFLRLIWGLCNFFKSVWSKFRWERNRKFWIKKTQFFQFCHVCKLTQIPEGKVL